MRGIWTVARGTLTQCFRLKVAGVFILLLGVTLLDGTGRVLRFGGEVSEQRVQLGERLVAGFLPGCDATRVELSRPDAMRFIGKALLLGWTVPILALTLLPTLLLAPIARGEDVRPDYRAIPRALYTDPEAASVGLLLEQALEAGHDAFEATADLATTAKGYTAQADGHITIVVDRGTRTMLGAFIGGPGASELIHECVLAIKLRVSLAELADTIHAFPTAARVMGTLFVQVHRELEAGVATAGHTPD